MAKMTHREPNQGLWRGVRPAHRGTQIAKHKIIAGNTAIVHTVNDDVVFYLTHYNVEANASAVDGFGWLFVRNVTDVEQYRIASFFFDAVGQLITSGTFNPPLEIPEKWDVAILSSVGTTDIKGFVTGWEE